MGRLKPLNGVNNGPYNADGLLVFREQFRAARFGDVRLHDCHYPARDVVDINVVFPDFSRDPGDPTSYDFERTDHYLESIAELGCPVTYRLGHAIDHHPMKRYCRPPADAKKWAQVCVGIARHYNEGWANGYRDRIARWEVWNEPDLNPGPHSMTWQGTPEAYYELYEVTARALKGQNANWQVGGPAVTGMAVRSGYLEAFLGYCAGRAVPLDFVSWHTYTSDPWSVASDGQAVWEMMARHGYGEAKSLLTEWHYTPPGLDWRLIMGEVPYAMKRQVDAEMNGAAAASFTAATLILLADTPVDVANYYTGDMMPFFGLFEATGRPRRGYEVLRAYGALAEMPQRAAVQIEGGGEEVLVLGAREGERGQLLAANFGPAYVYPKLSGMRGRGRLLGEAEGWVEWGMEDEGRRLVLPPWSVAWVEGERG